MRWLSSMTTSLVAVIGLNHCGHSWIAPYHYSSSRIFARRVYTTTNLSSTSVADDSKSAVEGLAFFIPNLSPKTSPKPLSNSTATTRDKNVLAEGTIVGKLGNLAVVRIQDDDIGESGEFQGKLVSFGRTDEDDSTGTRGIVVAHRPPLVFCYMQKRKFQKPNEDRTSDETFAQIMNQDVTIDITCNSASAEFNIVDCFGNPTRSNGNNNNSPETQSVLPQRRIFSPIPKVSDISLINHPMLTGITMIDVLAPIGRGQNMLLVGSDIEHMRAMVRSMMVQQHKTTRIVYAAATDPNVITQHQQHLETTIQDNKIQFVTSQPEEDPTVFAAQAVVVASTACSIAEGYAEKGENTLVIIDTIDLHKDFWDATTRNLIHTFGLDAVVQSERQVGGSSSEMRGFYASSVIQRSGQYNAKKGGGSVTLVVLVTVPKISKLSDEDNIRVYNQADYENFPAKIKERVEVLVKRNIPLTASTLSKIDIPVPFSEENDRGLIRRLALQHVDELISMSDGQIWLDERLLELPLPQQPPIDPQRSVTRIGIGADTKSRADAPALAKIVEGIRLDLSQAAAAAIGLDQAADVASSVVSAKQIRRQRALLLAMHQRPGQMGRRLSESCVLLLAAKEGYFDKAVDSGALGGTDAGAKIVDELLAHVQATSNSTLIQVDETLDLSQNSRRQLLGSISFFFATWSLTFRD